MDYTEQLWEGLVEQTKKDLKGVVFEFAAQLGWGMPPLPEQSMNTVAELIRKAITRVPIQICRVEGGQLLPMSEGQRLQVDPAAETMEDIAHTITFGLYDTLLSATTCPVLVVSAMGAQSTGKSYQLNHL